MKLIQFSSQNGSTKGGDTIWPYQQKLNEIFFNEENNFKIFNSYEFLSIVFRVSGKNKDFGSEGPEYLKKSKGRNVLTIDLSIPELRWLNISKKEFGLYLNNAIQECITLLEEEANKQKEIIDKNILDEQFKAGINNFIEYINEL